MNKKSREISRSKLIEARDQCNWVIKNRTYGGLTADLPYSKADIADLKEAKSHIMFIHKKLAKPYPPENGRIIIDNPKPAWMPKMTCTIVQLPFDVGTDYSWEELEAVIIELSLAGCDGMRIFGSGWEPAIEPFKKTKETGEYSFFKPNPTWYATLIQFKELLHKYHMSLEVDLYDNCSHKLSWNPFTTKRHNFSHYFYGYTNQIATNRINEETNEIIKINEVDFMMEYWDNRIMSCLDPAKGDKVRLGNELKSHVENDTHKRKVWAEKWGVKRAKNAFDNGFPEPICFSGSQKTAHKLHGFISAEEHGKDAKPHNGGEFPCEDYGWTYRTSCNEIHGLGTPEHVEEKLSGGLSQRRVFAIDDDGVGTNPDSKVPPSQRGYCEIRPNGSEYACTANTPTRIATVGAFINKLGNWTYCYSIGFLPRSILYKNKTVFSRFDKEIDAAIYWKLTQDLWGVDIRRKWSI